MATGPQGHTGTTGRKGLQGTPYGAPGTTFYSTTGRVDVTDASGGAITIPLTNAGGLYTIQTAGQPSFRFPSDLTSGEYGTFWTITNGYISMEQRIIISEGIFKLTIPGSVLTCPQGENPQPSIDLGLAPGQSITFVFFAGSGATAEYIAF
jgi:hypothetical protein